MCTPDCFVIAPIGSDGSAIRERSDQIFNHVITPVAKECGFKAIRADKISEPGLITTQVINHVLNDAVVVADLTDNNANVFYELAVRHAIRKPYVQIIKKGERLPFDVAGLRTIEIDHTNLDSVASAKEEIAKQIRFTTADQAKIESPISVAIDFERLRKSGDPEKRQLADIMTGMTELAALVDQRLAAMERRLVETRIMEIDIAARRLHDYVRQDVLMRHGVLLGVGPTRGVTPRVTPAFYELTPGLLKMVETAPSEEHAQLLKDAAMLLASYDNLPVPERKDRVDEQGKS
jgi:hypothetical protein